MKHFAMIIREVEYCEKNNVATYEVAIGRAKNEQAFLSMVDNGEATIIREESRNGHFMSWFDGEVLLP